MIWYIIIIVSCDSASIYTSSYNSIYKIFEKPKILHYIQPFVWYSFPIAN